MTPSNLAQPFDGFATLRLPKQRRSIRLGIQICRRSDGRARSEIILERSCGRPRSSASDIPIGRRCRQPSLSRQKCRGQSRADCSAKRSDAIRGPFSQKLSVTSLVFRLLRFNAFSRLRLFMPVLASHKLVITETRLHPSDSSLVRSGQLNEPPKLSKSRKRSLRDRAVERSF
jgi:hypothetical protein